MKYANTNVSPEAHDTGVIQSWHSCESEHVSGLNREEKLTWYVDETVEDNFCLQSVTWRSEHELSLLVGLWSGRTWTDLKRHGHTCKNMQGPGNTWRNLGKPGQCGQTWMDLENVERLGQTQTDRDRPRPTQTDLDRPGQIGTDPDRPRQTWTDPDRSGQTCSFVLQCFRSPCFPVESPVSYWRKSHWCVCSQNTSSPPPPPDTLYPALSSCLCTPSLHFRP